MLASFLKSSRLKLFNFPDSSENGQLSPVEVSVRSDIPIGAGLGSSAAFSVSLAGAIFHFIRRKSGKNGHANGWEWNGFVDLNVEGGMFKFNVVFMLMLITFRKCKMH